MSIRLGILYLVIIVALVYAWRDWFVALCVLIALAAVTEHIDMPRKMFGIPGATPWNFLLVGTVVPWLIQRRAQGLRWDAPRPLLAAFMAYVVVIVISGIRGTIDASSIDPNNVSRIAYSPRGFAIEHLLDPFKLMLPGIMIYDGARTRKRTLGALCAIALVGLLYAFMVSRRMDPRYLLEGTAHLRARLKLNRDIGLHANDLATIIGASCWGILASIGIYRQRWARVLAYGAAALTGYGMVMCFSRAGYIAWVGVGLILAALRWRKLFLILPVAIAALLVAAPNIPERLFMGFGERDVAGEVSTDLDVVTAGRVTDIWPLAMEEFQRSPLLGQGRRAILRTPMYDKMVAEFDGCPSHPHNAYLEILMDGGIVSLVPILVFFGGIWWISASLFRNRRNRLLQGVGGLSLAHVSLLMITAMSAQSFYPKRSMLPMMCAWALAARAWTAMRKHRTQTRRVTVPGRPPVRRLGPGGRT